MKKRTLIVIIAISILVVIIGIVCILSNINHKNHEHEWEMIESSSTATCFQDGSATFVCKICDENKVDVVFKGHKEEIVPAVAPGCVAMGSTEGKKCSVCGVMLLHPETIAALGHTYDDGEDADCNVSGEERELNNLFNPHI